MSTHSTHVESSQEKTVVCLGASFDPPHFAHAAMALLASARVPGCEIWLLPSLSRWDKAPVAPFDDRALWCERLASRLRTLGAKASLSLAEREFDTVFRGTVVFMNALRLAHPSVTFLFLCGEDSLATLPSWRDPTSGVVNGLSLLEHFDILVVPRPLGLDGENRPRPAHFAHPRVRFLPALTSLDATFQAEFGLRGSLSELASSRIRAGFKKGEEQTGFFFEDIEECIRDSGAYLYGH